MQVCRQAELREWGGPSVGVAGSLGKQGHRYPWGVYTH